MFGPVDVVVYADVSVPYLDPGVRDALGPLRGDREPLETFRCGSRFAVASVRGTVVGCARAVRAPDRAPVPPSPGLRALGPDRYAEWLAEGLELTEVVVDARCRGAGVGSALQRAVLTPARLRRAWAQPSGPDFPAVTAWLRGRDWRLVAVGDGGTVLLDPRHPGVAEGARYPGGWAGCGPVSA